jgi:Phosphodiester glycosidase
MTMFHSFVTVIVILLSTIPAAVRAADPPASLSLDNSGIRIHQLEGVGRQSGYVATVDQDIYALSVAMPFLDKGSGSFDYHETLSRGNIGQTLETILLQSGASVAISGGYLKTFAPPIPLGLLIANGGILNRLQSGKLLDAVVCFGDGGTRIYDIQDSADSDRVRMIMNSPGDNSCLQAGPLVVKDHVVVPESGRAPDKEWWVWEVERGFIGIDDAENIVMGIVEAVSMDELAKVVVCVDTNWRSWPEEGNVSSRRWWRGHCLGEK